jgi:23S rRNA-/tRNA-specific pseudouridylate synthase
VEAQSGLCEFEVVAPLEPLADDDVRMRLGRELDEEGVGAPSRVLRSRVAATRVRVVAVGWLGAQAVSLVELCPLTGRRHQLRVHMAALGMPILGDDTYGASDAANDVPRMMLHARSLLLPLDIVRARLDGETTPLCLQTETDPVREFFDSHCRAVRAEESP